MSSCAELANFQLPTAPALQPPSITFEGATLARTPAERLLAAHYCPQVVPDPFGVRGGAAAICQGLFGPPPTPAELAIAFDLRFKVSNPNQVPLPLSTILAGVTVFPAAQNQKLGSACFQLCPDARAACSTQPPPGACEASARDVRSLSDFASAAGGLLLAAGVSLAAGQPLTFAAPQVAAASQLEVTVRFSFGPEPMLAAMRQLAAQSIDDLKAGRSPTFTIPYRLEGTVWFDAGSLGRLAVGFGPSNGTWQLPTSGLVPR
ncbi:MAG TPA: hypothetical protein VMU50_01185 [Polyangia bacterium]|nr:hypothetical protein [Polyangia bacterium]